MSNATIIETDRRPIGVDKTEPQTVFGHLVRLAAPIVTRYHSDLYHDATWLQGHLPFTEPFTFYWAARESGTHIGTDAEFMAMVHADNPESKTYRFDITSETRSYGVCFHLTITEVTL